VNEFALHSREKDGARNKGAKAGPRRQIGWFTGLEHGLLNPRVVR
jgi:hypothetical protein